jgi:NhaP-type Na+/H+ or K+/H+ antiporter
VFVLNVLAFVVVGLQLRGILQRLDGHGFHYASIALAVLATAIVVRLVWVTGFYMAFLRMTPRASIGGAIAISCAACAASSIWQQGSRCRSAFHTETSSCSPPFAWCSARWCCTA